MIQEEPEGHTSTTLSSSDHMEEDLMSDKVV